MRWLALALLLIIIVGVACEKQTAPTPPTQQPTAPRAEPQPTANSAIQPTPAQPPEEKPRLVADKEVEKLFANSGSVRSYSFDVAFLPDGRALRTYYVKGDRAMVTLRDDSNSEVTPIEFVYLDFENKTAVGYCETRSSTCDPDQALAVDFGEYSIPLPTDWIEKFKYGEKSRSLTFNNVPVNVVTFEQDGVFYEAYVHNYYGYPVRVAMAKDAGMTGITGGYEYRGMAFNTVTDTQVLPPPEKD